MNADKLKEIRVHASRCIRNFKGKITVTVIFVWLALLNQVKVVSSV